MVFNKIKNIFLSFLLILYILPFNVLAYSDHVLVSGKNIGIQIKSKGIMVVGLYSVNGVSPGKDANISLGDRIIKVNDVYVNTVNEMINAINQSSNKEKVKITFIRGNYEDSTYLKLIKNNENIYKSGLYVKDVINGVGTLTYIDPETMLFGALGHEIVNWRSITK